MYSKLVENIETSIISFNANPNNIILGLTNMLKNAGCDFNNSKRWAPYSTPFNVAVVGQSTVNISGSGSGVTANNDVLPYSESEHFLIYAIKLMSGAGAALGSIDWQLGVSDAVTKNGRMSILNNGDTVVKNLPLTTFNPSTNSNDVEAGVFYLTVPILWRAMTSLDTTFNFSTVPATANQSLRIEYLGYKLI